MSKSFKKNPFRGVCTGSDKADKRRAMKRLRVLARSRLSKGIEFVNRLEIAHCWDFAKDGKLRFNKFEYPELARK